MTRAKRERRATSRSKRPKPTTTPPAAVPVASDLNAAPRALLEPEVDQGRRPDENEEASVQDPLKDWPELEAERDEWTLDRPGKGIEES